MVRVIFGFGNQTTLPTSASNLLLAAGNNIGFTGDFTDTFAPLDWKQFQPFYDEVHMLTPNTYVDAVTPTNYSIHNGTPNAFINVDYKFGQNDKPMVFENNSTGVANNRNIMCLVICRNLQDDTIVTTNAIEVCGVSTFSFYDA